MKKRSLLLAFTFFALFAVSAQDVIRLQECNNAGIQQQVDSLKQLYAKDGFVVLKEASITMESEYEMPVIVPLTQGSWSSCIIANLLQNVEVRMYP